MIRFPRESMGKIKVWWAGLWGERGCRSASVWQVQPHWYNYKEPSFLQPEMENSFSLIGKHLEQPEMRWFTPLAHPRGDIPSLSLKDLESVEQPWMEKLSLPSLDDLEERTTGVRAQGQCWKPWWQWTQCAKNQMRRGWGPSLHVLTEILRWQRPKKYFCNLYEVQGLQNQMTDAVHP